MAFKIADGYVEIHGRLNRRSVRQAAIRAGQDAGDGFGRGMSKRMSRFTAEWRRAFRKAIPMNLITFVPMVVAATAAIAKLSAQVVGLVGHMASALPAAAALIPVMGGLATSVLAVARAWGESDRMSDAIKKIDTAIKKAAVPAVNDFAKLVQRVTPMLVDHFNNIGVHLRGMVAQLQAGFDDRGLGGKFQGLLNAMSHSAGNLGRVFANLVEIIITVGDAASGAARRFTNWLSDVTTRFRDFLNLKHETGELQEFFDNAAQAMATWGKIFANTISAIAGMLAAAAGPGRDFAIVLKNITERWKEWAWDPATHGQIRTFLERLGNIDIGAILRVAAAITAVGLALKTITGISNIVSGISALVALGASGAVLTGLALAIGALVGAFIAAWNASESFRTAAKRLIDFLVETFGPIIQQFGEGFMEGFRSTLEHAAGAMDGLVGAAQRFMEQLEILLEPIGGVDGAARLLGSALGHVLAGAIWAVITGITVFITWLTSLVDAANATRDFLTSAWAAIKSAWNTLVGAVSSGAASIGSFFGQIVAGAVFVATAFATMSTAIGRAISAAIGFISNLVSRILGIPKKPRTNYSFHSGNSLGVIGSVISAIAGIPRSVSTTHTTYKRSVNAGGGGGGSSFRTGGIPGARSGGARGGMHWTGEDGPELIRIPHGSTVYPTGQSQRMSRNSGGTDEIRVILDLRGGDSEFARWLRKRIRVDGAKSYGLAPANG